VPPPSAIFWTGGLDGKVAGADRLLVHQFETDCLLVPLELGNLAGKESDLVPPFQRVVPLNVRGNYCTDFSGPSCQDFGKQDSI